MICFCKYNDPDSYTHRGKKKHVGKVMNRPTVSLMLNLVDL
jgi:hypothetical protein